MIKSSIKRWIDAIGSHLPTPEEMLWQLLALAPATECHIDGYYSLGTDHCVKDEHDRILMIHEAASENGEDARQFPQQVKDLGLHVTAAFSDYSQSFTEAIKAVFPHELVASFVKHYKQWEYNEKPHTGAANTHTEDNSKRCCDPAHFRLPSATECHPFFCPGRFRLPLSAYLMTEGRSFCAPENSQPVHLQYS